MPIVNSYWEIHYLIKLTDDVSRILGFIKFVKPLIETGNIYISYVKNFDVTLIGREYLIVSGVGAISCFSLVQGANTAIYLSSPTVTDLFKNYIDSYILHYSQPLFKYYPPERSFDFFSYLADKEDNFGDRVLFKDCFSILAIPMNIYRRVLITKQLPLDEITKAIELYQIRLKAFEKYVAVNKYHDIYMAHSLKNLLKNHQLCLYDFDGVSLICLEREEIIELLQNIIHLLEVHENYHITFLPDHYKYPFAEAFTLNCLLKEKEAVFIEVINDDNHSRDIRISIEEPLIVHAFEVYFQNFMQQISPSVRNKATGISWLRRQIETLNKANDSINYS